MPGRMLLHLAATACQAAQVPARGNGVLKRRLHPAPQVVREATVKWAMLDQLQHPPPEFASVVHAHFRLRAATLREQLGRWVAEARVPPPGCGPPDSGHATRLEALRVALEGELAKIAC
jgi:hypothetical protein